jgi:hypothetical protein
MGDTSVPPMKAAERAYPISSTLQAEETGFGGEDRAAGR